MSEKLLTAVELADRVGVSACTVVAWAKSGRIPEIRPSSRVRRFDYEDVLAALKRGREVGRERAR